MQQMFVCSVYMFASTFYYECSYSFSIWVIPSIGNFPDWLPICIKLTKTKIIRTTSAEGSDSSDIQINVLRNVGTVTFSYAWGHLRWAYINWVSRWSLGLFNSQEEHSLVWAGITPSHSWHKIYC